MSASQAWRTSNKPDEPSSLLERLASDDRQGTSEHRQSEGVEIAADLAGREACLLRLGALTAMNGSQASVQRLVDAMTLAGISDRQIASCLVGLVPVVGWPRIASVSAKVARALGYDIPGTDADADG